MAAFLDQQIRFDQIHAVNEQTLSRVAAVDAHSLEDLLALDREARSAAARVAGNLGR